jgi:two-component system, chemotaxis family, sensor kinase CheA
MSSILVLDDRAANRDLLSTVLGYAGHTVAQAATGEQALDLVRAHQPELIIVDLLMPGMNGCEFVGELRADPELRNTRVVLSTAIYDQRQVRSLAESCGVAHILVKPCEPEEIIRVVSEALDSNRGPSSQIVTDQFEREQLRVLNAKLIQKLDELELSKRLVEAKAEQLAISLKYKSEFFTNMSHELRTPLNSMLILAGVLQDNPGQNLTAKQIQYASVIYASGTDLLRLLNDILDLAQFESGTVTAEISELALVEIQDALQREFAHVAEHKGVSFSIELAGGLPSNIATDPARLRQVLNNLLANAFKFTEHGAVSVRVSPAYSGWSATNDELSRACTVIAFSITDTGIGMTVETQRRIFDDFVQGDGTTTRQYSGTGLGLSISRKLVRLLGGEITVTSAPDQGSTFTVYLPSSPHRHATAAPLAQREVPAAQLSARPALEAPAPRPSPPHTTDAGLAGKKALVIDDDIRNIFALTVLLERAHFEVVSAESGKDGVAILEQTPDIDIALVDIMMPGMDGYATIGAMRKLPSRTNLPILAVTAKVGAEEAQRCIDAGASAYIPKPVDTANLTLVLGEWLPAALPTPH